MKPLNNDYTPSTWSQVFWYVYDLTPHYQACRSAYRHIWYRFDGPFLDEDK